MKFLLSLPLAFGFGLLLAFAITPQPGTPSKTVAKASCPAWICTSPPDSRTTEEYAEQCRPVPAYDPSLDYAVVTYWCTSDVNPVDTPQLLPANYVIAE